MLTPASAIAIIGFGDAGRRVAVLLARRGAAVRAHDRLLATGNGQQMRERIEAAGVDPADTLVEALRGARLVIAATGDAAASELLQSVAPLLTTGQVYLDLSGSSTDQHRSNAQLVERSGAHYVAGHPGIPLLLAGAKAAALAAALGTLGCPARAIANLPARCAPDHDDLAGPTAGLHDPAAACAPLHRGALP